MDRSPGIQCRINKTTGPFSAGTMVEVLDIEDNLAVVKLVVKPTKLYLAQLKRHGINEDGEFKIDRFKLTPRRYMVGH